MEKNLQGAEQCWKETRKKNSRRGRKNVHGLYGSFSEMNICLKLHSLSTNGASSSSFFFGGVGTSIMHVERAGL